MQQSFQNKPAYFNYHPVGLIIAVILYVPVDVMSVQGIYAIEEDKQLADLLLPRLGNICTEQYGHCRFDNADDMTMAKLYEKFILGYYQREHPDIRAYSPQIAWQVTDGYRTLLPTMQSDIVLSSAYCACRTLRRL